VFSTKQDRLVLQEHGRGDERADATLRDRHQQPVARPEPTAQPGDDHRGVEDDAHEHHGM
jgi:hypothetical protein